MRLEVGKRYVRRDGKVTGKIQIVPSKFGFIDPVHEVNYNYDGSFLLSSKNHRDLIEEYPEIKPIKMKSQEININGQKVTIELTEEQIKAIKEQTKEKNFKRWRSGGMADYFYMDDIGSLLEAGEAKNEFDDFRYNSGNYFRTRQEAEAYRQKLLTTQKIKDRIRELNEGWEPDVDGFQVYHLYKNKYSILIARGQFLHCDKSLCFNSREIGMQLIEEFGDDLNVLFE